VAGFTSRKIQNGFVNFSVARSGTQFQNSKEIRFQVSWKNKGTRNVHNTGGIVSNNPVAQ
jgi:hypothetical protein